MLGIPKSKTKPQPQPQAPKDLHTLDYRNCKYQGQTQTHPLSAVALPHGIGIALDYNYTWVAGEWDQGRLEEREIAVVFGDGEKMYMWGQGQGDGVVVVYQGEGYCMYRSGGILVVDIREYYYPHNGTLTSYTITHTKHQLHLTLHTKPSHNASVPQLLQCSIPYQSLSSLLHSKFPYLLPPALQTQHELTLSYNDEEGIQVKLARKGGRVLRMGYTGRGEGLGKGYRYFSDQSGYVVEESIAGSIECYIEYQCTSKIHTKNSQLQTQLLGRPTPSTQHKCIQNLQEYYKRSLNFQNKFLDLSQIYQLRREFQEMLGLAIEELEARGRARTYGEYVDIGDGEGQGRGEEEGKYYEASIQDIKREIARTEEIARSRSRSRSRILQTSRFNEPSNTNTNSRMHSINKRKEDLNESMFKLQESRSKRVEPRYRYQYEEQTRPQPIRRYQQKQNSPRRDIPYFQLKSPNSKSPQQIYYYPHEPIYSHPQSHSQDSTPQSQPQPLFKNNANDASSYRSKELELLTMDYEEIQGEILQYGKEKEGSRVVREREREREKVSSTKNTTPRGKQQVNLAKEKNKSRSKSNNKGNNKSKSKPKAKNIKSGKQKMLPYANQAHYILQQQQKISKISAFYRHLQASSLRPASNNNTKYIK